MANENDASTAADITAPWKDREFAAAWAEKNATGDPLDYPRLMATSIAAHFRPETSLVIDVASGPGAFLAAFLDEFPNARGIWVDASDAMLEHARRRLDPYNDRVEYVISDMRALANAGLPTDADVVCTSRAAHHLDEASLAAFYASSTELLAPHGWVMNLDHTGVSPELKRRYQEVRTRMRKRTRKENGPAKEKGTHHHDAPLVTMDGHLDALRATGLTDVDMPWKGFQTCLFVARKPTRDEA